MKQLIIDRIQYYNEHPRKLRDGEGWQTSAVKPPKSLLEMDDTELLDFFEEVVTLYERFSPHNV